MLQARLEDRVGPVRLVGPAYLSDHCHGFTKLGRDGTGKGNIEPSPGEIVYGVLYRLSEPQLATLAGFEGGYRQIVVQVRHLDDRAVHDRAVPVAAQTFQAVRPLAPLAPTADYVKYYRVGMRQHGLPESYQRAILDQAGIDKPTSHTRHRGRHPADDKLFAGPALDDMRRAVFELSWLFERGYSQVSALKLVGDRYELRKRQRKAVLRCACPDSALARRRASQVHLADIAGREVWLDGFNCVIAIEAALSRGVILRGRDGAHRDMSSVHGSYRRVVETHGAVALIAEFLSEAKIRAARWLLDKPVSNSGRLATILREAAPDGIDWQVELVFSPDKVLAESSAKESVSGPPRVTASGDAWILDRCAAWLDIPGAVIERDIADAWVVDLGNWSA